MKQIPYFSRKKNPKMRNYYYFDDTHFEITVNEDTCRLTPYSFLPDGKIWEPESLRQFFGGIDSSKPCNIVDIGAQSGLYSLYAKFLPLSTFYSFEPFPQTFTLLNENLVINNITNVKTYNLAMSNKTGEATLNTCKSHNGLHTMGSLLKRFQDVSPIKVQCTTLDDFFYANRIPVHYIKIDTEGHEYWILQGGRKTIAEYGPIIQLEWNTTNMDQCGVTEDRMIKLMNDLGYKDVSTATHEEERLYAPCSV